MFAGSSLMEQFPIAEFLLDFDIPLAIYNRGVGGFVCGELQSALDECVLQLEPTRIFLNIGTNDLNDSSCDNEALILRYEPIVERILASLPGVDLTLLAYYPVNPDVEDNPYMKAILTVRTNERVLSANDAVKKMAERQGVCYLDVNEDLVRPRWRW